ncbi:MAG TPA: inositol monophosphatase family protein, partial [Thermoanaerobaculia bacterium]
MSDAALAAAVDAARAAGRVALKYYHGGFEIVLKPDATPVTQADREAERTIVEILGRTFPEHGFLGEEFGSSGKAETRWIIDPIDGTKNFVRHIPIWATLIALEEHGEITVGVIHNPVTGDLYTARRGGGAFLNGERIRISGEGDMSQAYLLHAGLRGARTTRYWDGFMRLVDATDRQRGFGDYIG